MKNAGKACNNRLYRHIRTFEKIVKNYFVICYKYAEKLIKDVWNLRLESLLYEYVRGEGNEEKFVNECNLEAFKEWEKVQKNAQNNTPSEEKE